MTEKSDDMRGKQRTAPGQTGRAGASRHTRGGGPLQGEQGYGEGGYYNMRGQWTWEGPHTGQGPRGYQRSDGRIHEEIIQRLTRHGEIDAREIEIEVQDGEVTLHGSIPDRRQKRLAEDTAETVRGVIDVHNRLLIRRGR